MSDQSAHPNGGQPLQPVPALSIDFGKLPDGSKVMRITIPPFVQLTIPFTPSDFKAFVKAAYENDTGLELP